MTVRTGRVVNIVLGSGDSSKFDLLGGAFGEAGDYSAGLDPGGKRFFKKSPVETLLRTAAAAGATGGGGRPRDPDVIDPRGGDITDPRYTGPRRQPR